MGAAPCRASYRLILYESRYMKQTEKADAATQITCKPSGHVSLVMNAYIRLNRNVL
jgi:hypothetical protein